MGEHGAIPDDAALSNDPIIVAIDDDPEVIALLRDSLAPAHFRVVGALNGDRGMELARILKPFAITLDIMMPEKDGWQVLREIKADPVLCRTPVIVMSIVSERSLGFSLGVTDYLVKPVDRRVLIDVLERLRERKVMQSALVVDDDYDARTLLADLLRSLGVRVRTCDTGTACIDALQKEPSDLLFLDVDDAGAGCAARARLRLRGSSLRESAHRGGHAQRSRRQPGMDAPGGGRGRVRGAASIRSRCSTICAAL